MTLSGEKRRIVDTAVTNQNGSFSFKMGTERLPGMYVVIQGPGKAVELVYNNENIQFTTTGFNSDDGIQIISSVENLIYYDYIGLKALNMYKIELLNTLIQNYPRDDEFWEKAVEEYNYLKNQLLDRVDVLVNGNSKTLASNFIVADCPIIPDPILSKQGQVNFLKSNYFNTVDFNDTTVIRSTFLTSKVVGYLSLFQNEANSQEELEDFMLVGVDSVLAKAAVNQKVYEFLVDFLIGGFESIGFEKGLEHIANANMLDNFCENTERKLKLANKLELIKKLSIGNKAPNFTTVDIDGKEVSLYDINSEKTLLIFWASWCPHCDEIMPIISKYYTDNSALEVIAVSIDEKKEDFLSSVNESNYGWINIAELKGWNGDIVEEYGVVATPSIFLLDKDKRIIAKPIGKAEIDRLLGE